MKWVFWVFLRGERGLIVCSPLPITPITRPLPSHPHQDRLVDDVDRSVAVSTIRKAAENVGEEGGCCYVIFQYI